MRRTATLLAVLIIVASLYYGLGRRQGAVKWEPAHSPGSPAAGRSASPKAQPSPTVTALPNPRSPDRTLAAKAALDPLDRTLRILRRNELSGQLQELRVRLRRAQLYFNTWLNEP